MDNFSLEHIDVGCISTPDVQIKKPREQRGEVIFWVTQLVRDREGLYTDRGSLRSSLLV